MRMDNQFFERPILNAPYEYPTQYLELDEHGQPTQRVLERRRRAEFITPILKPRKRKSAAEQQQIVFDARGFLSARLHGSDRPSSVCCTK
jgi:type III restriction enzyme